MFKYGLLAVLLVALIPYGRAFTENDLDESDHHCLKQLNLDKKVVIDSYDEKNFIKEGNANMNAFFTCAWKRDKLQNEDGTINSTNLQKMIEVLLQKRMGINDAKTRESLTKQGIEHCKGVKGSDHGDTCVKMYNCLLKHINEKHQH